MVRRILVTVGLVAALQSAPGAQPAGRQVELADYYKLVTVSGTALSPDGRTVAFVRTLIVESENRRHSEIWTVPADGSAPPRRLTSPAFSSAGPRWSPDGRLLAFTSRRPVNEASGPATESTWFLRLDQAGGEAFQIAGVGGAPVFSPDNQWIAFTKAVPPATPRPAPATTAFEKLTDERFKGRTYDWMNARFDGRGYLPDPRDPYATPPLELFVVARDGGTPRQLTTQGVDVQTPSWKADSRALVFTSNMFQRDEYVYDRADIFTVDLEGRTARVTNDGFDHDTPVVRRRRVDSRHPPAEPESGARGEAGVRIAHRRLPLPRRRRGAREPHVVVGSRFRVPPGSRRRGAWCSSRPAAAARPMSSACR